MQYSSYLYILNDLCHQFLYKSWSLILLIYTITILVIFILASVVFFGAFKRSFTFGLRILLSCIFYLLQLSIFVVLFLSSISLSIILSSWCVCASANSVLTYVMTITFYCVLHSLHVTAKPIDHIQQNLIYTPTLQNYLNKHGQSYLEHTYTIHTKYTNQLEI